MRDSLVSVLGLDATEGIRTLDGFKSFYKDLSAATREAQAFSSTHFSDSSTIKLASGVQEFNAPTTLANIKPAILRPVCMYSLTRWASPTPC